MSRYRVRRWKPEKPVCPCKNTLASYEVVDPDGDPVGLYCSSCAETIRDDLNAGLDDEFDVTNSQEGDEVR